MKGGKRNSFSDQSKARLEIMKGDQIIDLNVPKSGFAFGFSFNTTENPFKGEHYICQNINKF